MEAQILCRRGIFFGLTMRALPNTFLWMLLAAAGPMHAISKNGFDLRESSYMQTKSCRWTAARTRLSVMSLALSICANGSLAHENRLPAMQCQIRLGKLYPTGEADTLRRSMSHQYIRISSSAATTAPKRMGCEKSFLPAFIHQKCNMPSGAIR
jgi:hypothetical protein